MYSIYCGITDHPKPWRLKMTEFIYFVCLFISWVDWVLWLASSGLTHAAILGAEIVGSPHVTFLSGCLHNTVVSEQHLKRQW